MRHNKFIGWDRFFGVVEQLERLSPWLSRQILRRASEWPFWTSGVTIAEWGERQVWVKMPLSFRTSVDNEMLHGHLLLAGELALRLVLLRQRQEFPFQYRITASRLETHHRVDQEIQIRFMIPFPEWETIRLELARASRAQSEFVFPAQLADGRLAASFQFQVAFDLEKFLTA